jgi:hypothetical protein
VKHAILIASSLALLSLIPAAAADISILGGTAVIHTDGDPGVSVLGEPLVQVATSAPCGVDVCTAVYGNPAGLGHYIIVFGTCSVDDPCLLAGMIIPPGLGVSTFVVLGTDPATVHNCNYNLVPLSPIPSGICVDVFTDPICVTSTLGEIICET